MRLFGRKRKSDIASEDATQERHAQKNGHDLGPRIGKMRRSTDIWSEDEAYERTGIRRGEPIDASGKLPLIGGRYPRGY